MPRWKTATLICALAGCSSSYLKASGKFASVTSESVAALHGLAALNGGLCQERAGMDYVAHRIEAAHSQAEVVRWTGYESRVAIETPQKDGSTRSQTWDEHCRDLSRANDVVEKVLTGLAAYAGALQVVADADFTGKSARDLATSAGALIKDISPGSTASDVAGGMPWA